MNFNRREFLKGGMAALGFLALDGLPVFAAPADWKPKRKPDLVFGVLADTHLMTDWGGKSVYRTMTLDYIKNAFAHFKEMNVDAVIHLGDAAHRGQVRGLEFHREEFDKVFGAKNPPPLLVVAGNHEWQGDWPFLKGVYKDPAVFKENVLAEDFPRLFEKGWGGIKYEECWHKEVKGYHFFGKQWGVGDSRFGKFIKDHAESCNLKGAKPFFILTHKMTYFKCNSQLRDYPNAIAFCGHWHSSLANWDNNIMYDRNYKLFPYINCGACRYDGGNGLTSDCLKEKPSSRSDADYHFQYPSRQGLVVSVFDGVCVVMDRREFTRGGRIGPPWMFPVGQFETKPYSHATLKTKIGNPEFRPKAKIQTYMDKVDTRGKAILPKRVKDLIAHMYRKPTRKEDRPSLWIEIPMADGNLKSRVFSYDVVIMADDDLKNRYFKSMYFAGVGFGEGHEDNDGITLVDVPVQDLPKGKKLTVAIRPVSSLGTKGKSISTTFRM